MVPSIIWNYFNVLLISYSLRSIIWIVLILKNFYTSYLPFQSIQLYSNSLWLFQFIMQTPFLDDVVNSFIYSYPCNCKFQIQDKHRSLFRFNYFKLVIVIDRLFYTYIFIYIYVCTLYVHVMLICCNCNATSVMVLFCFLFVTSTQS